MNRDWIISRPGSKRLRAHADSFPYQHANAYDPFALNRILFNFVRPHPRRKSKLIYRAPSRVLYTFIRANFISNYYFSIRFIPRAPSPPIHPLPPTDRRFARTLRRESRSEPITRGRLRRFQLVIKSGWAYDIVRFDRERRWSGVTNVNIKHSGVVRSGGMGRGEGVKYTNTSDSFEIKTLNYSVLTANNDDWDKTPKEYVYFRFITSGTVQITRVALYNHKYLLKRARLWAMWNNRVWDSS